MSDMLKDFLGPKQNYWLARAQVRELNSRLTMPLQVRCESGFAYAYFAYAGHQLDQRKS